MFCFCLLWFCKEEGLTGVVKGRLAVCFEQGSMVLESGRFGNLFKLEVCKMAVGRDLMLNWVSTLQNDYLIRPVSEDLKLLLYFAHRFV